MGILARWTGAVWEEVQAAAAAHKAAHEPGGSDAMTVDAAAGTGSLRTLGTGAAQAAVGNHGHSGTYVAQSLFDAAGDLITATANDTPSRLAMGTALQVLRVNAGATALEYATPAAGGGGNAIFGDGADGVIDFDGSTTRLGLVPSSGIYTLTRDIFLAGGSQISGTAVVKTNNFRVYCSGAFTIGATATLHNNGNNASGATAGGVLPAGSCPAGGSGNVGQTGGAGGVSGAGVGGQHAATAAFGGAGGSGGIGGGGTPAAGAGGNATAPTAAQGGCRSLTTVLHGRTPGFVNLMAGAGGGGGGGNGGSGGGGGGGGGILTLVAKTITNSGIISANGGNGANGVSGNSGGGGGGGAGAVLMAYNTFTGNSATATGGTKGNGIGTGANGVDGSSGNVISLANA